MTLIGMLAVAMCGVLQGAFFPVGTFTELVPGAIHEQNDWRDFGQSGIVTTDPDDSMNQVLAITNDSAVVSRPLKLLNNTVRMVFLRFRFTGLQNYSFGLSDSTFPSQFDDFEVEIGMSNAQNDLRINNGGQYDVLTSLTPHRWYFLWILVDNIEDEIQVYLHFVPNADAGPTDQLESDGVKIFEFRNRFAQDLRTFFVKTGGGSSQNVGPLYLDDLYIETTSELNLSNPIPHPPVWLLSTMRVEQDLQFKIVGDCSGGCHILQSSNLTAWFDADAGVISETPQWVVLTNSMSSPARFYRVVVPGS